jgi:hypothetical protein
MLRMQHINQVRKLALLPETREEMILFKLLVIILDKLSDDIG